MNVEDEFISSIAKKHRALLQTASQIIQRLRCEKRAESLVEFPLKLVERQRTIDLACRRHQRAFQAARPVDEPSGFGTLFGNEEDFGQCGTRLPELVREFASSRNTENFA